jgi:decaprenylphospho-beta-D-erythro-pentofuranosid-2-ulose 2-reductase
LTAGSAQRVLLIGGTSEIGLAIVRRLAADSVVRPYLRGRDRGRLEKALAELEAELELELARGGGRDGSIDVVDATDLSEHAEVIGRAFERSGGFDVVVIAVGVLGAQAALDADPSQVTEIMQANFAGAGSLLWHSMRALRSQPQAGTAVVLSSVAAERPRSGNAIYGASKAGLDALAQGLADASVETGPRVLVVRPGFVVGRMTAGLPKAPFATTPEAVAEATVHALERGGAHTIWVPGTLRYVFAILRHLPRPIYRRLPL